MGKTLSDIGYGDDGLSGGQVEHDSEQQCGNHEAHNHVRPYQLSHGAPGQQFVDINTVTSSVEVDGKRRNRRKDQQDGGPDSVAGQCESGGTDGRFSGGSTGLCIGHVAPEAVDGGPIAFVEDGDKITVDIAARSIDLHVDQAELDRRRENWTLPENPRLQGTLGKYAKLVRSAAVGAVTTD